jgi:hypothetical protein
MSEETDYGGFLDVVYRATLRSTGASWVAWCGHIHAYNSVAPDNYLLVHLCLDSDTIDFAPHVVIACLSARPEDADGALPEVRWQGPHRYVAIRDWYAPHMVSDSWRPVIVSIVLAFAEEVFSGDEAALIGALQERLHFLVAAALIQQAGPA